MSCKSEYTEPGAEENSRHHFRSSYGGLCQLYNHSREETYVLPHLGCDSSGDIMSWGRRERNLHGVWEEEIGIILLQLLNSRVTLVGGGSLTAGVNESHGNINEFSHLLIPPKGRL